MKLNLKLLNSTFTFDVTGKISMVYTKDGDIEIVESAEVKEPVKELKPVPVTEPVKVEELNEVVESSSPKDMRQSAAMSQLVNVRDDEIVQDIRDYLGVRINDKTFSDITTAAELYAAKYLRRYGVNHIERRIREIVYIAMFVVTGAGPTEACDWFRHNHSDADISVPKYSRLANGIGEGARFIANLLWPHRLDANMRNEKEHNWLTVDGCHAVIDALLKGYSVRSIAKYFNAAIMTIYKIKNGKHRFCSQVDYDGEYPICCVVEQGSELPITTCKCCGAIIPVKRLLYMPGAKTCVDCQDKEEKHK